MENNDYIAINVSPDANQGLGITIFPLKEYIAGAEYIWVAFAHWDNEAGDLIGTARTLEKAIELVHKWLPDRYSSPDQLQIVQEQLH